ncbi:FAD-dependent oxidoreductase [Erysipelotrichaceae bacterium AF15-26LB]|nr:hypothetical protein HMPREF0983_03229 [Erysipelotrichaceae bacterium 3_1_53]MCR0348700.1 FAD-dependent oxidoreductase [[Clostridium] innocuum]RJV90001.1 FAD-dependent oxidoreductase [Erysipelotrichaceae bacterium AF19-24AC]RJV90548.1 FAD-dependent oxidoreductase [Erysipelotrichaceae bacterium AF15-26LB]
MKTKFLIIGAGITGLAFAKEIGSDYLIVEKEREIGGFCRTIKSGGFIWDYAGHFFHFKDPKMKQFFLDTIEESDIIYREKHTKIVYHGDFIDYPFQSNIHQLNKDEFIDCLYDLFNKKEKESYDSFLDMLYGKFGNSIVEKFLRPYNEKLYAVHLNELDSKAMGRFFPYADTRSIINNMKKEISKTYNDEFVYPKQGVATFLKAIYNDLDKNKVILNSEAVKINKEEKYVVLNSGETVYYDYVINTSPLNMFLNLFNEQIFEDINKKLSYNQVLVFNLGFDKGNVNIDEHWIYCPDKNINFYRMGFYNNILGTNKLSMYIEIGYPKTKVIDAQEIENQLALTLNNLKKLNIIDDTFILEDYCSLIMNPAYVHINDTADEIQQMKKDLAEDSIFTIGRYGGWTYCSMEDCMLEAIELANRIKS